MRRPINWVVFSISVLFLVAGTLLSGCGGTGTEDETGGDTPEVSGMLRKVRSASELETSLKSSLPAVLAIAQPLPAAPTVGGSGATNYTGTYTAEAGVDEFDHVRYDGTHLYVGPDSSADTQVAREIRILQTTPAAGTARQVSAIPIEARQQVHGFYVSDGRLVMFTSAINYLPYVDFGMALFRWEPTELEVHVYDVVDPAHPSRILHAKLGGVLVATRRVDDRIYLVSRYSPFIPADSSGKSMLATMSLADLLPKLTVAGNVQPLVAPSDCYVTNTGNAQGYPVLTTITSFSMKNPLSFTSACYNEHVNGIYASASALYVSQPLMGTTSSGSATRIHKFSLTSATPAYAGSVEVKGQLWLGGNSDFRMNEYQGMLRVVTTEFTTDAADQQDHHLFIVRPKSGALALEVVSSLPNDARPEELGKPNEALFGVRFANDRAYLVTFRRMDPLYVLDLSSPTDPRIAGQLEIPGFSDFLHPVTRDLLLALGTNAGSVKLELFDVSSIEHPQSRGALTLGGPGSYSEAMWERHAFTWLPSDTVDRVAIPLTIWPQVSTTFGNPMTSLHQFEILGKRAAGSASLQPAGVVAPFTREDESGYSVDARSYIHGDTVYFVRGDEVWSTSWFAPSEVQGPF